MGALSPTLPSAHAPMRTSPRLRVERFVSPRLPFLNPTAWSPDPDAGQSEEGGVEHGLAPLTLQHADVKDGHGGGDNHKPDKVSEISHLLSLVFLHHELHLFHGAHLLFLLHGETGLPEFPSQQLFQSFCDLIRFPGILKSQNL